MSFPPLHKSAGLHLSWLGGLCGAIVLLLLPFRLPFATPGNFFGAIVSLQIFFALLIWPLFVPSLLREDVRAPALLSYVGSLLLLGLPLVLIAANVSSVGGSGLLRSQAQVAGIAALGAGVIARYPAAFPWYLLGAFWMAAALPFWGFLNAQLGAPLPSVSIYVSPFWSAAASESGPAWIQSALFGVAGLVLLVRSPRAA